MTESTGMKVLAGVLVIGMAWAAGSIFTLSSNDSTQNANIKTGHDADVAVKSDLRQHGERLARLEATDAGITALLDTVVKNQDRILAILDGR